MLCRITMRNFVHFKEEQDLRFTSNCPVLFVGASSSGKTATLELIRRCLDSKINSSLTNRVDPNRMAYAFCKFSIDVENDDDLKDYDKTVTTGIFVDGIQADSENDKHEERNQGGTKCEENLSNDDDHEDGNKWVKTDIDDIDLDETSEDGKREDSKKDAQEDRKQEETKDEENSDNDDEDEEDEEWDETGQLNSEENGQIFYKIIIYMYKKKMKVRTKTFLLKEKGEIDDLRVNMKLPSKLFSNQLDEENYEKKVKDTLKYIKEEKGKIYKKKPKLWNTISSTYVGVLSMRGIGTFQYTSSRQISKDQKEKNYMDTCKQAEIINDLIDTDEVIDVSKEEGIFNYLTDGKQIKFSKESDRGIIVERGGKSFPLLKTSVGILEAKQFSLLMAHKKLKTICYEEPDRGMHPQMIQRMKEILHRESKSKTIITVTHSPFLVDSMCYASTYIFCKQENGMHFIELYDQAFPKETVTPNLVQIEEMKNDQAFPKETVTPNLVQIEEMKTLLFSSKVLLVEGKSDKVVMQGIFKRIFEKPEEMFDKPEFERIKICGNILSHQILPTGGSTFTIPVKRFCDKIKVTCRVLLDRDAEITTDNRGCIEYIKEGGFKSYKEKTIWAFLEENEGFNKLSTILEKKGKFIWKEGDLEDVLLSNTDRRENIFKLLNIEEGSKYRKDLKREIKKKLSHGLTPKQSEELTKIIVEFKDVKRLLNFLGYS